MTKKILFIGLLATLLSANALTAQQINQLPPVPATHTANASVVEKVEPLINEAVEPADSFKLLIDGNEIQIAPDKPVDLKVKGETIQATLKVEPLKTFNYGGIELQYPRYFTFEADLNDKDVSIWNLSGSQCVLMIQRYPAEMNHQVMAEMLLPRFGEKNSTISSCSIELAGSEARGTMLTTTIGDSTITQEIFSFKIDGGSLLLILQDTLGIKSEPSEEGRKFRELLKSTLKFAPMG